MTIKQYGGVFGRNPTFNNVTIEGTLTFDGDIDINSDLTISGNLYLPDNSKAIFGDNDDLQIYHDGSNSYVSDQGTGDLRILAADFRIRNAADDETMIQANSDADVSLWYNNSKKLATTNTGIDVTGSVTADGLTVDGDGLFDADNAKVEIKSFAPRLTFTDDSAVGAAADKFIIQSVAAQSSGDYEFVMNNDQTSSADVTVAKFFGNGDISFYNTAGNSQALFWDASAESLGIGTTTPSTQLHVLKAGSDANVTIEATGTGFDARLNLYANSTGVSQIRFGDEADTNTGLLTYDHSDNSMQFRVDDSERMRIDSGGNLLVGKTVIGATNAGFAVVNDEYISSTNTSTSSGSRVLLLNRQSAEGTAVDIRQANTTVGTISVTASATAYNTSSDQRLKENIADADDAGSKIDAIQVRKFDWKADGSHQDYGMVAQELLEVAPEAVAAPEDPEDMMGVDYSKLVPMMLKEIQSLRARIAALES